MYISWEASNFKLVICHFFHNTSLAKLQDEHSISSDKQLVANHFIHQQVTME
jgi:hypothetical protein